MFGPGVLSRDDTMLGVCQALADDFGFNPLLPRLLLGVGLLFSPVAIVALYLGMGLIVLISRLIVPEPAIEEASQVSADNDDPSYSLEELALAA